jgi:transcriptional regulator with XRE-family HTH domain
MTAGTKKPAPCVASREQCLKARAWLGWTPGQLALRAHVSDSTVRDFESGRRTPIGSNLGAITGALEAAGLSFKNGAIGIKKHAKKRLSNGRPKLPSVCGSQAAPLGTGRPRRRGYQ